MSIISAGEKLKKIRQEKGFSLEEVQKKTKIHLNILKAIEGDSLTNLSPIYLKGFLKIYCKFLRVDPKEYVPDYKAAALAEPLRVASPAQGEDKALKTPSFFENAGIKLGSLRPNKRMKTIIIYILAIAIFSVVLFKLGKFISLKSKAIPLALQPQGQKPQVKMKAKPQNATPKPQLAETKLLKESSGGISLVISAKENCLVFVKVDGRVVLHRVLEKGRSDSWKAKEKIELSLSNAAAVELIVNGLRFTKLGRRGQQLKNIVITEKDGLRIPR